MTKALKKKIFALALVFAVVFSSLSGIQVVKTEAATVSSLEDRYAVLENQLKKLQNDMKNTQNKKNQQLNYKKQLDTEISLVEQQIDNLNSQVSALNVQIAQNEAKLTSKEGEISENDELFKARLRAMYMQSETSMWEMLLSSESFADFTVF